jgi:NAD dependent epimerase/dehydratase
MANNILVTGADGFIGSHLVEALVRSGERVVALAHYNATSSIGNLEYLDRDVLESVEIRIGDICDAEFMAEAIKKTDVVFHLAALIAIPYSYEAPRSYLNVNAGGTLNVLEAVHRGGHARVVLASTSEVYGSAQTVPIAESHPLQAQSPYSATKIAAEKLAESFHRSFGTPVVVMRPFNTFGPRQSARAFIPTVIRQALGGGSVHLGLTTPVRDLTYVSDTVSGLIAAGNATDLAGDVFNLGTGQGFSVGDVAKTILRLMGSSSEIVLDQRRVRPAGSEVDRLISDNSKFRQRTGWSPKLSLEEGLQRTIAFFKKHADALSPEDYVR